MSDRAAWLMMGVPAHKKRERRARWFEEVVGPLSGAAQIDKGMEVFREELEEDRR